MVSTSFKSSAESWTGGEVRLFCFVFGISEFLFFSTFDQIVKFQERQEILLLFSNVIIGRAIRKLSYMNSCNLAFRNPWKFNCVGPANGSAAARIRLSAVSCIEACTKFLTDPPTFVQLEWKTVYLFNSRRKSISNSKSLEESISMTTATTTKIQEINFQEKKFALKVSLKII